MKTEPQQFKSLKTMLLCAVLLKHCTNLFTNLSREIVKWDLTFSLGKGICKLLIGESERGASC